MKSEIRNPKFESNSKSKIRNDAEDVVRIRFRFRISDLIRISNFEFRISAGRAGHGRD